MGQRYRLGELMTGYFVLIFPVYLFVVLARLIYEPEVVSHSSFLALIVSIVGGAVLVAVPGVSPAVATVLLVLAGRSELGPLWVGTLDVFFLLLLGTVIWFVGRLVLPGSDSGRFAVNIHPLLMGVVGFSLLYGVQFVGSQHTDYAVEKVQRVSVYALLLTIITAQVMLHSIARKVFAYVYLLVVGSMSAVALALAVAQYGLLGIQRITPIGGGPITLGRFTGFAALICVALYLQNGRKLNLIWFAWFMSVTLLNGSRGPLMALIITMLMILIPALLVTAVQNRALVLVAFFSTCIGGLAIAFFLALSAGVPFAWRYALLFTGDGGGSSVSQRLTWLSMTGDYWQQAPLWGHGVASWGVITGSPTLDGYPHNIFTELLVENGLLITGVFVFLMLAAALLGCVLLLSSRTSQEFSDGLIGLSLLVFSMLGAQISGDLFDNRYIWVSMGWVTAVSFWRQVGSPRYRGVAGPYITGEVNYDSKALQPGNQD